MKGYSSSKPIQLAEGSSANYKLPLICLAVLYFMLGFITVLNDTLVPFFKEGFTLTYSQSSLVQFYFYLTYGLISLPAGKLVAKVGYSNGIVIGFLIAAFGAFLFFPAAFVHNYYLFLSALFVVAIGIVLLQVSANPYVTALGPEESAASRLTLIQGVGSLGTTVAPLFGGYFILSKLEDSQSSSDALVGPYIGIGLALVVIAIIVYLLKLPVISYANDDTTEKLSFSAVLKRFKNLRFGFIALFFYVGAEVAIGTFLTNYIADQLSIKEHLANFYLSFYWGGMLVGRFLGAYFMKLIPASKMLLVVSAASVLLITGSLLTTGMLSVWLMVLVGLCNSIMFASIFALSVSGLKEHTGTAAGLLSSAIVGGALISYLMGVVKDHSSWMAAFILPLLCYVVIVWFAKNKGFVKA